MFADMPGLVESKTRQALRRKYAELIDPESDADTGEIEEPVAKNLLVQKRP